MEYEIINKKSAPADIGASFRTERPGPEQELVGQFLERAIITGRKDCKVTIFQEPKIASGFPDLVIVVWDAQAAKHWHLERSNLSKDDIRVMNYIVQSGPTPLDHLEAVFSRNVSKCLMKLEAVTMVRRKRDQWEAMRLSSVFAARYIIAIEAKVRNIQSGLKQAHLNTWFASASYLILPSVPTNCAVLSKASSLGLGVWGLKDAEIDLSRLESLKFPLSYASWQFNEWAWRASRS